tara:strand:+ start:305 stop:688 length:384 start_codon:yes stop_codon:yes gene_type:complete
MYPNIIYGKLFDNQYKKKLLLLEGDYENYAFNNDLLPICDIKLEFNKIGHFELTYIMERVLYPLIYKYKMTKYDSEYSIINLKNNKILFQEDIVEFKDFKNMFSGTGIIDINGTLYNIYTKLVLLAT